MMFRHVTVNGIVLKVKHIEADRAMPTIIFLHDSLGCIALWKDFPEQLGNAVKCNVLVYDRQGYGLSDPFFSIDRSNDYLEKEADVLNALIRELNLSKVILFGHSDGASIALITAAKYPSQITALIVEGAHIFVEDITRAGIKAAVKDYEAKDLGPKLKKYHGDKTENVFKAWTNTWLSSEFSTWNIEHFLSKIVCPVLVIQGENDEFGSIKQVAGITNQVSGKARQLLIPAIGHTPHKEAPGKVLETSASFINALL